MTVTLQPLAMLRPARPGIYELSQLKPPRSLELTEFLAYYASRPRAILVDQGAGAELLTAYGYGWDCWYFVAESE
jgi:hypothetical protein